ncbi:sodium/potassium/calcium exchanger 1-like [Micropterus salmoides]|uniref:sodium/potassium/calcium exchanger 1-like n=1 Tax=Micropterus salmoides TaxID=27706 RepID=UPI0018EB55D1|nr:sodium/potassium/calcium exchanger 1-like [Micropterus salmoides]
MFLFGFGLISSRQQVRRQLQGSRLPPRPSCLQPHPPPSHGLSRKTPGAPRAEGVKKQPSEGGTTMNTKSKSSSAAARLKAVMRSSGSKTSGLPPTIHLPWNKARVRPVEERGGGRDRLEGEEGLGKGCEREEAGKRENKWGGGGEMTESGRERGDRGEMVTWGRNSRGGVTNSVMRNAAEGREGVRPEHRGELPGLSSSGYLASLDSGLVINGSYFQTSIEASKPPPVKQKLSEALSFISLTRRLHGPTRVGDEQWSNGKSWDRAGENSRKMDGSVGDMSVSSSVSERAVGEGRRGWERELGEENSSSEGWWKKEKRFHDSDSETGSGSKVSHTGSPTASVTDKHANTESDTETQNNDSDSITEMEEGTPDTGRESESGSHYEEGEGSESERESGLESEDEGEELSRKSSKGSVSISSASSNSISIKNRSSGANLKRESRQRERSSHFTVCSARPQTSRHSRSSHETTEEENEESGEEEEEAKGAGSRRSLSSRRATKHIRSDISSGVIDTSDDLSPIVEDTEEEEEEEEERSSSHGEDEEEGDLENESAD